MSGSIGLGIVTNDRPEFFQEVMDHTPMSKIASLNVWDSSNEKYVDADLNINTAGNATVGVAKNGLMRKMFEEGVEHIFLQEHDIKIIDDNVFDVYIETAKASGLMGSLNFAWHGDGNKDKFGQRYVKLKADLGDGLGIDFTHNGVAPFSYIHRSVIEEFGYHDEKYINCWEHLDYYLKQSISKRASYWWWFTDIKDSHKYIQDIDGGSHQGSVIRKDPQWSENMKAGVEHFKGKFGYTPFEMKEVTQEEVENRLDFIIDNYITRL